jgi:hypothetical protein
VFVLSLVFSFSYQFFVFCSLDVTHLFFPLDFFFFFFFFFFFSLIALYIIMLSIISFVFPTSASSPPPLSGLKTRKTTVNELCEIYEGLYQVSKNNGILKAAHYGKNWDVP